MAVSSKWSRPNRALGEQVERQFHSAIDAYRADPKLLPEHANQEDSYRTGGYAERQLFELVQNAADAILRGGTRGRIEIRLTDDALYCANEGAPFDAAGIDAVTHAYLSQKRGDEIGRFGLGFKSILSITDNAQVYSTSVSFEFNSPRSQAALHAVAPAETRLPQFRAPTLTNAESAFGSDPVLAELGEWAETIIKMPSLRHRDRLKAQITGLQAEFLLFANSVNSLRVVVSEAGETSKIELRCDSLGDDKFTIAGGEDKPEEWIVVERMHRPSKAAREEIGEALSRKEFKISYAAPLSRGGSVGQFWAYFPLRDQTTATGAFNAPWAVSDDRTTLLDGKYNREILEKFVELFVETLPRLSTTLDPAAHLDYMPSRAREVLSPADRILSTQIPLAAASSPMIPDSLGNLVIGSELTPLSFDVTLPAEAMRRWQDAPHTPSTVPHYRCYATPQRRTRLRDLFLNELVAQGKDEKLAMAAVPQLGVASWLSELAASGEASDAALALMIARATDGAIRDLVWSARIIPTTDGELASLSDRASVFLGGGIDDVDLQGFRFVSPHFLEIEGVQGSLAESGFRALDGETGFRAVLKSATNDWGSEDWERLWNLALEVPTNRAALALEGHVRSGNPLLVMTKAGLWREPSIVIDEEAAGIQLGDPSRAYDPRFHSRELGKAVGVIVGVDPKYPVVEEPIFDEYRSWAQEGFQKQAAVGGGLASHHGRFGSEYAPGPLGILKELHDKEDASGQAKWSEVLLRFESDRTWKMTAANGAHLEFSFPAPHIWAVEKYGLIMTTWGPRRSRVSLHPSLARYAAFLPVTTGEGAKRLSLVTDMSNIPVVVWREFLARQVENFTVAPDTDKTLGELVIQAIKALPELESIPSLPAVCGARVEATLPEAVRIASGSEEAAFLAKRGVPYLRVENRQSAELLALRSGARFAGDEVSFALHKEGESEPELLTDRYFALRNFGNDALNSTELIRCARIARRVTSGDGVEDDPLRSALQDGTLYVESDVDDESLLTLVNGIFHLGLTALEISRVLQEAQDAEVQALEASCRSAATNEARLRLLFTDEELESRLPSGLVKSLEAFGLDRERVSLPKLFLDVYGFDSLRELANELAEKRFNVPRAWSGSSAALRLIKGLGFPSQFAGERGEGLPRTVTVLGRPELDPLHDYQETMLERIRTILRSGSDGGPAAKAMVELPTGAGKTRVTVEAVVRSFLDGDIEGPVLWIAQSEELCEQAVQTWSEVWRDFSDKRSLLVGRLWSANEVAEPDADLSVIVATDAKLDVIRDQIEYEWLSRPSAVIVDEAHRAGDAQSYTRIFKWLGVDGRSQERPLLGLSATPFKGDSKERTRRLAARFGGTLIKTLGSDPYKALQVRGVLAQVDHEILPGARLELSADELHEINQFSRLNSRILERVATNEERTKRLIDHISSLDASWPVLVFTSSVLSAQIIAALLKLRGITAASVSGGTRKHERRRIIQEFKNGNIRVLVNCDVLTQGFDAPQVRALYIARPTLSPNAYIQMAGRGLRGPRNGGSERCLIVDLADSFLNYQGELAYREFDDLWNRM